MNEESLAQIAVRYQSVAQEQGTSLIRMRFALMMLRAWNSGTAGYDAEVVLTVNQWIDGGMQGPIPYPRSPFFREWAEKQGWTEVRGFVGMTFTAQTSAAPGYLL